MLRKWEELPDFMRIPEVRPYWEVLNKKRIQIGIKRLSDLVLAFVLLIVLAIPMGAIAVWIKADSEGPVLYRQERVTTYGKIFRIHKFRTMVNNADKIGSTVTVGHDSRITKVGTKLRKFRLDELPQLFDVINGDMSFVGVRPEAVKYVEKYKPRFYASLLMPAGITSDTSIRYKDEDALLSSAENADDTYINVILPDKMKLNLDSLKHFSLSNDFFTMLKTVLAMLE